MASRLDRLPTEFSRVASDERISSAVAALEANGMGMFVIESGAEARSLAGGEQAGEIGLQGKRLPGQGPGLASPRA